MSGWNFDSILATTVAVLEVAVGLGFVVFVHELGHFAVAKLCGVKCDKFFLGFDIGGLKFCSFRWGETEYGIGILPLGGYVKMLGQEDNPARLKEEIERAKLNASVQGASPDIPKSEELLKAEQALYDPRSFLAQSVPKRMAIVSAGVIMNLIFAFLMAVVAYRIGVCQVAAGVGQMLPGEAAWQANLKVGDRITEIAGRKIRRFRDLQEAVSLGNIQKGIPVVVDRTGEANPITITVMPSDTDLVPRIGILNPCLPELAKKAPAVLPGSAAARATPAFEPGDRIVQIDGKAIEDYGQIHTYFAQHPDQTLKLIVERQATTPEGKKEKHSAAPKPERITIELPPAPLVRVGVEMELGPITAIQKDSPASLVGLKRGDMIREINHEPVGDPLTLPYRLRNLIGKLVVLSIQSKGEEQPHDVEIRVRPSDEFTPPLAPGNPVAIPELGIAYSVLNRVQAVSSDEELAATGLQPGDELLKVKVIPPDAETLEKYKSQQQETTIPFSKSSCNWACVLNLLQSVVPGTTVELTWERSGETHTAKLTPTSTTEWFNPDRGLLFEPIFFYQESTTWQGAIVEGWEETLNATLLVYRTLHKLGTQVSLKALGGPKMIFEAAKHAADQGVTNLLIFLTILSANLAVMNFLPIPLLDGGLMMLLIYEAIVGKPANERVQVVLTYIGLTFIVVLMLWVCSLDFGWIAR
jgi:regulator of sigma E protease